MDLLYGVRILTEICFLLSQFTRWTYRQTDGWPSGSRLHHHDSTCSTAKQTVTGKVVIHLKQQIFTILLGL